MQLWPRYGIRRRRFEEISVNEKSLKKLSRGSKLALEIALNENELLESKDTYVSMRHLLAPLLFIQKDEHKMGVQEFLFEKFGVNREGLKNVFMDYIAAVWPEEFETWKRILAPLFLNESDSDIKSKDSVSDKTRKKEVVPYHDDDPTLEDKLERKALAEVLYQRIKEIWVKHQKQNRGSFLVHLGGSWGSGKSTFINFLQKLLENNKDGESWITVHFNAWQHQRLNPPWWYLMDSVYKTSLSKLNFCDRQKLRFKEYRWRWNINSVLSWMFLILFLILISLMIFEFSPNDFWAKLNLLGKILGKPEDNWSEIFTKIITALGALIGYLILWAKFLTPNSAKYAGEFIKSSSDPLRELHKHYCEMVNQIKKPICVFIDDLDRCQGKYVVELLEGIQTLFREAKVAYVVIADGKWLCACYANVYKDFKAVVDEPGKPLGYFFLDKTFQLSFSLPSMGNVVKGSFWKHLIDPKNESGVDETKREILEKKAVNDFKAVSEVTDIGAELEKRIQETDKNPSSDSEILIQAYRRAAVLKFNEPELMKQTAHALQDFSPLLESNPRFMKRLVNEYSMEWTIDKLQGRNIQREKLARWTILKLRWPLLAEHLLNHPEDIKLISYENEKSDNKTSDFELLLRSTEVVNVIQGGDLGGELDEVTVRKIANFDS
jgi:hypothetical protein